MLAVRLSGALNSRDRSDVANEWQLQLGDSSFPTDTNLNLRDAVQVYLVKKVFAAKGRAKFFI